MLNATVQQGCGHQRSCLISKDGDKTDNGFKSKTNSRSGNDENRIEQATNKLNERIRTGASSCPRLRRQNFQVNVVWAFTRLFRLHDLARPRLRPARCKGVKVALGAAPTGRGGRSRRAARRSAPTRVMHPHGPIPSSFLAQVTNSQVFANAS